MKKMKMLPFRAPQTRTVIQYRRGSKINLRMLAGLNRRFPIQGYGVHVGTFSPSEGAKYEVYNCGCRYPRTYAVVVNRKGIVVWSSYIYPGASLYWNGKGFKSASHAGMEMREWLLVPIEYRASQPIEAQARMYQDNSHFKFDRPVFMENMGPEVPATEEVPVPLQKTA